MRTAISGVSGSRLAYYVAQRINPRGKALIIVSTERAAERFRDDLSFFAEQPIYVLPEEEEQRFPYEAKDSARLLRRVRTLDALTSPDPAIVIAPVSASLRPLEPRARFCSAGFTLRLGQRIEPARLRRELVRAGYVPASLTESPGTFSARGGILDLFAPNLDEALRIEFFDDEIDSLRFFDPETQRSTGHTECVRICPAAEFLPTEAEVSTAITRITRDYDQRIAELSAGAKERGERDGRIDRLEEVKERLRAIFLERTNLQIYADYLPYFDIEQAFLWAYLAEGPVLIADPVRVAASVPAFQSKEDLYRLYGEEGRELIFYTPFPEPIQGLPEIDRSLSVKSRQMAGFNGQLTLLAAELRQLLDQGYTVWIVTGTADTGARIRDYLEDAGVHGDIRYAEGILNAGMVLEEERRCYVAERDIFPGSRRHRPRLRRKKAAAFSDFHSGDYVVHEEHGIGRFEGIETLDADGQYKDYLKIHYAGSDVLYIPTDQLDRIQRYIGSEGQAPHLSRLSGGSWHNTRARAQRAIEAIAEDLVQLYAERELQGGYAFGPDTVWQQEFEDSFPYEETEDQRKAIEEIKADMETALPMDRLLCGDVGYGKTEVAARAIFKCLAEGKQAVMLAPTTLLASQHYSTLRDRFERFPFHIELLSRFVSEARQRQIVDGLRRGSVDFAIGTHRLLSQDVSFKDLGLLVIDEEQRFGVKAKEQIRTLRQNVDVLSLSATPIPRTLNMSLTGIKSISTIETPPQDRYPVQTFVVTEEDELIRSVIERERARGGQVFVVSRHIRGIQELARRIEGLVPEARVGIGHGRMEERSLEQVMLDFVDREIDVLVSTTILENGIDIPNANTILILDADQFGLSQLYQLRGRVGRSNRLAYAYLLIRPRKTLSETARKRLSAIREFTEFGAGFRLAMRDLELRGAGNILGEAQHGHIASIGYELYIKEVDRAVRRLRGEALPEPRADIGIELEVSARIPESYIADEALRLQAYQRIAEIQRPEEAEASVMELIDRYGDPPELTLNLIRIMEIKCLASPLGVSRIAERGTRYVLHFAESRGPGPYPLIVAKDHYGEQLSIGSGTNPELFLRRGEGSPALRVLELLRMMREAQEEQERQQLDIS